MGEKSVYISEAQIKRRLAMKKIISLFLVLTMCLAISSCAANPENYSLALAAKAMEVKHSDSKQEGYEEFIDKLDAFAAKLTYEV